MIWKEEIARTKAVQMDNLRGLVGIRKMDKVSNVRLRELYEVTKGVNERIDEGALRWFGHVERIENDRIGRRMYVREVQVITQ